MKMLLREGLSLASTSQAILDVKSGMKGGKSLN